MKRAEICCGRLPGYDFLVMCYSNSFMVVNVSTLRTYGGEMSMLA